MRVSMIGLVNILAGRKIVPELIQFDFTAGGVFKEMCKILFEPEESNRIKKELAAVKKSLGEFKFEVHHLVNGVIGGQTTALMAIAVFYPCFF